MSAELTIFMGVSGCGKSTIAKAFADEHSHLFIDADDYHSSQAKHMMGEGVPLNDEIRQRWVERLIHEVLKQNRLGKKCVMAFSGLKAVHREPFIHLPFAVAFFHLVIPIECALNRVTQRKGHFFSPTLIHSQFEALESPRSEEKIVNIDAKRSINDILQLCNDTQLSN